MQNRTDFARTFRKEPTHAERKMWSKLRDRRFLGLKFKRQVPIDRFVVDFVSSDGGQHSKRSRADSKRTQVLESLGYLVLRFWNNDVLTNMEGVLELIASTVRPEALEPPHPARKSAPTSPQRGEG
jgi:very-short-patch-repair endonuclease